MCAEAVYLTKKNGSEEMKLEFFPYIRYKDLSKIVSVIISFHYCQKYVHKLPYNPRNYSPLCENILKEMINLIVYYDIELVLY